MVFRLLSFFGEAAASPFFLCLSVNQKRQYPRYIKTNVKERYEMVDITND